MVNHLIVEPGLFGLYSALSCSKFLPIPRLLRATKKPSDFVGRLRVPRTGFEPAHLAALLPENSASTNFATWAGTQPLKIGVQIYWFLGFGKLFFASREATFAGMRFLIIQTAFLGDVVLATPVVEQLRKFYPEDRIDFLLRKGNESLLKGHPKLDEVLVWNKQEHKTRNLWGMMRTIRARKYDYVINLQRFASSGLITAFSGAYTIGFDKNPLSRYFTERKPHVIGSDPKHYVHEVQRNLSLIEGLTDNTFVKPKLYPSSADYAATAPLKGEPYITMSPASVWFTKQLAREKWAELIDAYPAEQTIYLLGAPGDKALTEGLATKSKVISLAGQLTLLQSTALMADARMNYVNDSAPMHLASAMNAPTTAVFCSTVPYFGFGPLADNSRIVETPVALDCRPCGLHGYKACPQGHFKCALTIPVELLKGGA